MDARKLQEAARRLVDNEVYYCASHLISAAFQNYEAAAALGFDEDALLTLGTRQPDADDYVDCAPEGWRVVEVDGGGFRYFGPEGECQGARLFDSALAAWQGAFRDNGIDEPDGSEIFEHWIISDWLAQMLETKGESVARDVLGFTIWGRATTGQAIYIDSVIEDITLALHGDAPAEPEPAPADTGKVRVPLALTPAAADALASCAEIGEEGLEASEDVRGEVTGAIASLREAGKEVL